MGLDVGTKTIGVAVSDQLGFTAQGVSTIERRGIKKDLEELKKLIHTYEVSQILVGLPLNMNGSEGPRAKDIRAFAKDVEIGIEGIPVIFWDERLSTAAVERDMIAMDMSRARRAEVIDQQAAVFILQGALDRLRHIVDAKGQAAT